MSRRTTRRPGRPKEQTRPSLFFMVALALGVLLLIWGFLKVISTPVKPPAKSAAISTFGRTS